MADPQRTINVVTTSPLPSSSSDSSNSDDSSSDTKSTFTKRDKLALRKLKRKAEKLELAINSSIAKRPAVELLNNLPSHKQSYRSLPNMTYGTLYSHPRLILLDLQPFAHTAGRLDIPLMSVGRDNTSTRSEIQLIFSEGLYLLIYIMI